MELIDGLAVAKEVNAETGERILELRRRGIQPGLAVVLVGDHAASRTYVRQKELRAVELGMRSVIMELPAGVSQGELEAVIEKMNEDSGIHGILVQLPLPGHLDAGAIVRKILPSKDVDGFHPVNVAKLAMEDETGFVPCTPLGCVRLLESVGVRLSGARVVVVGRSMIVGKPLALLLMRKGAGGDATVTVAHSRTRDLAAVTRGADVVVAALGRARVLGDEHISDGCVVVDVGINRVVDASSPKGWRLVGDVDFEAVAAKCRAITPVPGGVGPMTIAMLMANTVTACERLCA